MKYKRISSSVLIISIILFLVAYSRWFSKYDSMEREITLMQIPVVYSLNCVGTNCGTNVSQNPNDNQLQKLPNETRYKPRPITRSNNLYNSSSSNQLYQFISPVHPSPLKDRWTHVAPHTQAWRTAYYDNRSWSFGGPSVITIVIHNETYKQLPKLFCNVVYSNGKKICLKDSPKWYKFGTYKQKPNEINLVFDVVCKLPTHDIPDYVFLSPNKDCSAGSAYIPLYNNRPKKKVPFAVCLHKALFDQTDYETIAAWIEMNKALGAELILIYYQDLPKYITETVQKYVDEGLVEALDWNLNISEKYIRRVGQYGVINDCFFRTFHRAEYIAFHDIDEVIVPHKHPTWHGLIKEIDRPERTQFRFCNSFWHDVKNTVPGSDINHFGCSNFNKVPIMFKRTTRTVKPCKTRRWKNIIKPEGAVRVGIHGLYTMAEGYSKYDVPEELGLMHHYRPADYAYKENQTEDLVMSKYVSEVMQGLKEKLCS